MLGYDDGINRVVAGLQNISMGVGHIWTPTNLFNSKNSYALEPDETFGVLALSYTRYFKNSSSLNMVISQKKDKSYKYAINYKLSLDTTDITLNMIKSNAIEMIGFSIEGDLGESGIEYRSEGAYINSGDNEFFQGIVGANYAFVNGINLSLEALYSSKTFTYNQILATLNTPIGTSMKNSNLYIGAIISYNFNIYLSSALIYIESIEDKNSRFISPSLTYTINDNNSLSIGAIIYNGSSDSEFGILDNSYYIKYMLSF